MDESYKWLRPWMVFVFSLILMFFRMPDRFIHGFLWAEDGPRMLQEVYDHGRFSIFATYPGYAVLVPKLISYISLKLLHLSSIPRVFVFSMAFLWGLLCSFTFKVASTRMAPSYAVAIALFPVLAPHTGEVFLNLTNFQWLIAPGLSACLWMAATDQATRPALLGAVIFSLSLTGPFSVIMAPFLAILCIKHRPKLSLRKLGLAAAYAVPVLFQAWHMYLFAKGSSDGKDLSLTSEFAIHAIGDQFITGYVMDQLGDAALPVGLALLAAVAVAVFLGRSKLVSISCIGFAAIGWILAMYKINSPGIHLTYYGGGTRYVYPMSVALFYSLIISASSARLAIARRFSIAMAACLLMTGLTTFGIPAPDISWSITRDGNTKHIIIPPRVPTGTQAWDARIGIKS